MARASRRRAASTAANTRDLSVLRVRDFTRLMKLIARHDLWDEAEQALAAQGRTAFRVDAEPMRIVSAVLRDAATRGDLPPEAAALHAASCSWCSKDKTTQPPDGGADGGSHDSDWIPPGHSQGE